MPLPKTRSQAAAASTSRNDPPVRLLEGYHSTALVNKDPEKFYVFAHMGDQDTGVPVYEYLNFEKVVSVEGGVQLGNKKTPHGELITYRGHVLMAGSRAECKARWEHMQQQEDLREKAIVKNRGGIDPMRGIRRDVLGAGELRFVNETSELVTE
jgi:hypothetical protein